MPKLISASVVMAEVERVMSRPFAWGGRACDCSSAACDVFAALWGIDPLAPFRSYSDRAGALRLIRAHGGAAVLADAMAARAGLRAGHAIGGLALSGPPHRRSLLVCIEPGIWAGKSLNGFAILRSAEKGWHA